MNPIFDIFQQLFTRYIDTPLAVLIVLSAYFFRKYLCDYFLPKWRMVHKVLLWATLVSIAYYFIVEKPGLTDQNEPVIYLITYFFATSFYEIIFSPMESWVKTNTKKSARSFGKDE